MRGKTCTPFFVHDSAHNQGILTILADLRVATPIGWRWEACFLDSRCDVSRAHERGFDLTCRVGSVQLIGNIGFQQEPIQGDLPCVFASSFGCEHALTH